MVDDIAWYIYYLWLWFILLVGHLILQFMYHHQFVCFLVPVVYIHVVFICFLSFYPLFTFTFLWLWLFLVLCCMFSCYVSHVLVPAGTLFNCSLWVYVICWCVWFSNCFRMSSTGSVILCSSNWSQKYCSAVICVVFTCLLFLVISHPVSVKCIMFDLLLWLWCPFLYCTMGPWSTIFLLSCYSSSYGNKIKISGNIILVHFVCLLMNAS